jgi:alpha-glucoside transport system permease protein
MAAPVSPPASVAPPVRGGVTERLPPSAHERARRRRNWVALAFLLPALVLLGALVVYPIIYSIWRSLFDANGTRFRGLGNYRDMFTSSTTRRSIKNNVIWVVVAPTLVTAIGLVFAVLTERIRWSSAFKILIFMPMAVSFLAAGIIFRLVYDQNPDLGVANAVTVAIHDLVAPSSNFPGARPRDASVLTSGPGGFQTVQTYQPGGTALLPLVGLPPGNIPKSAQQAQAPTASPDHIEGTVWLDFAPGGGGRPNQVDPGEKGLPGMRVQALENGKVVASATADDAGRFSFKNLKPGSYTLRLPASEFTAPFRGVTWLSQSLATWSIIGAYIWIWAGFAMVLIAAGLAALPRDLLEAARVDGASEWQVFRRITAPLLAPVLLVVFVTLVINVLKVFDLVLVIPPGSVEPYVSVLALEMWQVSFGGGNDLGLGSAIAVFLFLLVVPAMIFNIRRFRREQ